MNDNNSADRLFARAQTIIPGGVNSPVRSFGAVGGSPLFIERGAGPYLFDRDGKRYVDYMCSWGAMILGHAHPEVTAATQTAVANGMSFGATTEAAVEMAAAVIAQTDNVDMIRFVNSGTEAGMTALRVARGFTGRNKIVKFNGCYHGHSDGLLVQAGSGLATLGLPASAGVPPETTRYTLSAEFNDAEGLERLFAQCGDDIAAVILEPVMGNAGCIGPQAPFLATLRRLCDRHGSLLIADEVMTGFRVAAGGAQRKYNLRTDLTMFGKVIGGGMPAAAVGGRRDVMSVLAPVGKVYQAGTLSANPMAMAAGLTTLRLIAQDNRFYERLRQKSRRLVDGLCAAAAKHGIVASGNVEGGMFGFFFAERPPQNYSEMQTCRNDLFKSFFHAMLHRGVYLPPSAFESCFMSAAHDDAVIEQSLAIADSALAEVAAGDKKT